MLSIIIPAYNEEKRIGPMLEAYGKFFTNIQNKVKNKIIVINLSGRGDKDADIVSGEVNEPHK